MLLDETRLLARLIDDLRVLSLSEAGELRLETELIEPRTLVADAIGPIRRLAARAEITLEFDGRARAHCWRIHCGCARSWPT